MAAKKAAKKARVAKKKAPARAKKASAAKPKANSAHSDIPAKTCPATSAAAANKVRRRGFSPRRKNTAAVSGSKRSLFRLQRFARRSCQLFSVKAAAMQRP